jgi:replication-associated recombination protein RarA
VDQEYMPEKIRNRIFYRPTDRGLEEEIGRRMEKIVKDKGKKDS